MSRTAFFKRSHIAPCGLNCGRCHGMLRRRNPCPGCRSVQFAAAKPNVKCVMRFCTKRKGTLCFHCPDFPCAKLRHLDKRYRLKYRTTPIANLEYIRDFGIEAFLEKETAEGMPGGCILCMHDQKLYPPPQRQPAKRQPK
jgi:hypothetical protein